MPDRKPNIILILADDMGFADIGCLGSEIRTPHIDAMAATGATLTSMYNCARCCPTRASLLTGLYPHKAGIGHMGLNFGTPAYQGHLRNDSITIAEALKPAGYRTLMSGKWHVGGEFDAREVDNWRPGDVEHPTPRQRGFDHFYGILDGACSFFSPHYVMRDDDRIEVSANDFHLTDAISDKAVEMIGDAVTGEQPFFLYLAYTAPHWPLHAHDEDIAKYDGVYSKGWDACRSARHEEMNARGLLQCPWDISPRDRSAPAWSDIKSRDWEAARMAVYAAMVDRMDQGIGRVLSALRRHAIDDDTIVMFLSDNGGCAEFMAEDGWAQFYPEHNLDGSRVTYGNLPSLRPGGKQTFMSYDLPWANVSNAPFRLFKHWVHEGGISTPLIVGWPKRIKEPIIAHAASHVVDIMPTLLEAAGAGYPSDYGGHELQSLDGESQMPLLDGTDWQRQQPIYWEHEGNSAMRLGRWKLVRQHGSDWELYDMELDRTELNDLVHKNSELVASLKYQYQAWADTVGVRDWHELETALTAAWGIEN
ncbi:MAG: arylsulfatase [Aestuariivirgaceae bacterium]